MPKLHSWLRTAIILTSLALLAIIGSVSSGYYFPSTPTSAAIQLPELEVGDWVFRQGGNIDSRVILQLSGGNFSHIGLVVQTKPQTLLIHATTDDEVDKPNQVLLTPIEQFLQPSLSQRFAIARPAFLTRAQQQQIAQQLIRQQGQAFVLKEQTQPHLYCTTLLANAIRQQQPDFQLQWQQINLPLLKGKYLFPEAFWQYPDKTIIYQQ